MVKTQTQPKDFWQFKFCEKYWLLSESYKSFPVIFPAYRSQLISGTCVSVSVYFSRQVGWSQFTSANRWVNLSLFQPTGGLVSVYFSWQVDWFQFISADRWVGLSLFQLTGVSVSVYFSRQVGWSQFISATGGLISVYFSRQVGWSQFISVDRWVCFNLFHTSKKNRLLVASSWCLGLSRSFDVRTALILTERSKEGLSTSTNCYRISIPWPRRQRYQSSVICPLQHQGRTAHFRLQSLNAELEYNVALRPQRPYGLLGAGISMLSWSTMLLYVHRDRTGC